MKIRIMNHLGIIIEKVSSNELYFSRPLLIQYDKDTFMANILRDIDFSLLMSNNEEFKIYVVMYPDEKYYLKGSMNKVKILLCNNLKLDNIVDNTVIDDFRKGTYKTNLIVNNYSIELILTTIYRKEEKDYIVSNPYLYGKKSFLSI